MAKDINRRYQSAAEVLRDLDRLGGRATWPASDDFVSLDTVDANAASSSSRLSLSTLAVWFQTPSCRPWLIMGSLLAAFALGGSVAWWRRAPRIDAGKPDAIDSPRSRAARIPKMETAGLQLLQARDVLPAADVESGLWAVLENYNGDVNETVAAATDLQRRYLPKRQYDLALEVADYMAERENLTQKMIGELFRGIIESRRGKASDSNKSFVELFERAKTQGKGKEIQLPRVELDWVARQYLLALRVNYERLGKPVNEQMIDNFWTTFLPSTAPGRGGRRP